MRHGHVGRGIVYLPTAGRPGPNRFRQTGDLRRPAPPINRPVCALGNLRDYGGPVCYGADHPTAIHNECCPEARRLARRRALLDWCGVIAAWCALAALGAAAMLLIWRQTCGMGVAC